MMKIITGKSQSKHTSYNICFSILYLFIYCGCTGGGNTTAEKSNEKPDGPIIIDVTEKKQTDTPFKLSVFAESIAYIPLSDQILLHDIGNAAIKVINDTIYIDGDNIFQFTSTGEFIKKIFKEGPGPREATKYGHIPGAFNINERYVTFKNSTGNTYKTYSFDGEYIGKESTITESFNTTKNIVSYFNNAKIVRYTIYGDYRRNEEINILGPYLFYAQDIQTDSLLYAYPNPIADETVPVSGGYVSLGEDMAFTIIDSQLWFKHAHIDTIYRTSDLKEIHPEYIFKTDNSFMDIRKYMQLRVGIFPEAKKRINGFLPLPEGDLLFTISGDMGIMVHANSTGQIMDYTNKQIVNDLDEFLYEINLGPIIATNRFWIEKGYLYFLVESYEFFENNSSPPFKQLTEESNPVVVKIKLK